MSRSTREGGFVVSTLVDRRPILKAMLNPKAVALIGATEAPESVGHSVLQNLHSFGGIVHLVMETEAACSGSNLSRVFKKWLNGWISLSLRLRRLRFSLQLRPFRRSYEGGGHIVKNNEERCDEYGKL